MAHERSTDPPAASAERRPTIDPDLFVIPAEHLPPGFAESLDATGLTPVAARAAATVVMMRESSRGPEALLLRRHRRSGFAAGAWVFPGGVVDAGDRDPALLSRLAGPGMEEWGLRLETTADVALGFVAAALREAWEETGILVTTGAASEEALERGRRALLEGSETLAATAERESLRLDGEGLLYVAHWITPEPEPRRYDTRFFVARVAAGTQCTVHEAEMTDARWMRPEEAVEAFQKGEMKMLPPTVDTLRRLRGARDLDDLWSRLGSARVSAILPRMRRHPEGVSIEIPR